MLFYSSVFDGLNFITDGLFLAGQDGIKKIVASGDALPTGKRADYPIGATLNDKGEVAFSSSTGGIYALREGGIYLYSSGQIEKILLVGEPTPIGGRFAPFSRAVEYYAVPRLNNNSAMAFKAAVKSGSAPVAIFLASTKAMVKVVAVGDQLPSGETIRAFDTFALNDRGQIAFFALDQNDRTLGVFKATPVAPDVSTIKLKRKKGAIELRVNGNAMITGDTVIEINGVPLEALDYPVDFREDGGFTTRVVSRDPRLQQMIQAGQPVQVTVFNSLTNLRSAPLTFVP